MKWSIACPICKEDLEFSHTIGTDSIYICRAPHTSFDRMLDKLGLWEWYGRQRWLRFQHVFGFFVALLCGLAGLLLALK